MSSRQEEKQRRREERLAQEQAASRQAALKRRLQLIGGSVLGLAVLVAVAVAIGSGGSDGAQVADGPAVPIPAKKITDFDQAVKAAGCEFKSYPSEGAQHLPSESATNDKYKTNPPTSGLHSPVPAEDGVYAAGNSPTKEGAVHALEHGRINIQYAPGTPKRRQDQLQTLFSETFRGVDGYHQLVFENTTDMPYAVAAVGWTKSLGCAKMNDQTFDAIRAFRERFVDKGPELVP